MAEKVKRCGNCKYTNCESSGEPCSSCDGTYLRTFTNWEPKEEKSCKTCDSIKDDTIDNPCEQCFQGAEPEPHLEQTGMVIQLDIGDESCMSVANAICNYCEQRNTDIETALIFMEELTEHIDSYVRAERKWMDYYKSMEA